MEWVPEAGRSVEYLQQEPIVMETGQGEGVKGQQGEMRVCHEVLQLLPKPLKGSITHTIVSMRSTPSISCHDGTAFASFVE